MDGQVKGKLKLKGDKVTKKKKAAPSEAVAAAAATEAAAQAKLLPPAPPAPKTKAELATEAKLRERQEQRIAQLAAKSHKEKVKEFNEYLNKLSEHHDLPRISGA